MDQGSEAVAAANESVSGSASEDSHYAVGEGKDWDWD